MENLKRNWLVVSKLTWEIWRVLTRELKSLKNVNFNGLLLTKSYNIWAKKVQRSYVWLHLRLIESLKKKWLVIPRTVMRNLANFHQSMFESVKIGTLTGSFHLKQKIYELKIYRGVFYHDNEEWYKLWWGIELPAQN